MFKSNLKIAWRNLMKNKGYTAINISGLALGIAVVLVIGLWIYDELTFNKYHENHKRIAQIYERAIDPDLGGLVEGNAMMYVTGTVLQENYKDYFKHVLRANWIMDFTLNYDARKYTKTGEFIERGALEMFSLEMVQGSYASLDEPNAVVLSASTAMAIFGEGEVINKPIKINNRMEGVVKGVYKDLPKNTRFTDVDFFANWELFEKDDPWIEEIRDIWDDYSFNLYVELRPGVDFELADKALNNFFVDYAPESFARLEKYEPELFMHPMDRWHLYSEFENGYATKGRITFVKLFIGIGLFVLFLACINFMNLSTARSEKRAREVGIRKTLGSIRNQLISQFLSESWLLTAMAMGLAIAITALALPWFNTLSDKQMQLPLGQPIFWLIIGLITLLTGLVAGSYPALFLSSFRPVKVLKGTFKTGSSVVSLRRILVVFQFIVSITLAIGTLIVFGQVQHTKNRPIGYDSGNLITVEINDPSFEGKYNLLREELLRTGLVREISQSSSPLTGVYSSSGGFNWEGKDPTRDTSFGILRVSHDYGATIGWKLVEGRDFSRDISADSSAIILNESAARYIGMKNPVGQTIKEGSFADLKIIGVVKDLVMQSPYSPVKQTIFFLNYNNANFLNIKLEPADNASAALAVIGRVFEKVVPSANFDYKFVDQEYNKKFQSEQRMGSLAGVLTVLAIVISCLGLFGLTSFIAEQRTKEIGVRKVLGASLYNLWHMLSKDFVILVALSGLIAIPFAYILMNNWLENYAYRMQVSWWIIAMVFIGALLITLLTVSFQAIRTASVSPIKSLRTE